jgi:predicted DNA-binding protein (MmcQ/YjbR family)
MTVKQFIDFVLSFSGTEDAPHFDRTAFKVTKKRIFVTLHEPTATVNVKLSPADQKLFCKFDKKVIYPIDNKWGKQGWTTLELRTAPDDLIREAIKTAYDEVFKKSPSKK